MLEQLTWKVGGQQGEGIASTGDILSTTLNRLGYYLYTYRHFSSRIKGGHTNDKIRISTKPVHTINDTLDVLVAFDQETIDLNIVELRENGIVIADAKFNPIIPDNYKKDCQLFAVPFTDIAIEFGSSLMKNMVAIGASSYVLGFSTDIFKEIIHEKFSKKGEKIIESNMKALKSGADYIKKQLNGSTEDMYLAKTEKKNRLFMIGNEAIALGALASGVRFMPAYPITPASEVMEYLTVELPKLGGSVVQTEDEISAVAMAIGANYAGTRSFTSTSGPGLSLMMEAIGLAGMIESPLVIANVQRGGPSTGLPTKQEQSDLNAAIYGTHGDIPKIVIAPSTVEEAFYDTVEAFNLADKYQCPVIILSDLLLGLGKQTTEMFDFNQLQINRGKLIREIPENHSQKNNNGTFNRYAITEDGISERTIPGVKDGIHYVTGVEHDTLGKPSENALNREKQMLKRLNKINTAKDVFSRAVELKGSTDDSDLLLIGMGTTRGIIEEAIEMLEKENIKTAHAHIRLLHPFPKEEIEEVVHQAKNVIVVEYNGSAQLKQLAKTHINNKEFQSILQFNGVPLTPNELVRRIKEMM